MHSFFRALVVTAHDLKCGAAKLLAVMEQRIFPGWVDHDLWRSVALSETKVTMEPVDRRHFHRPSARGPPAGLFPSAIVVQRRQRHPGKRSATYFNPPAPLPVISLPLVLWSSFVTLLASSPRGREWFEPPFQLVLSSARVQGWCQWCDGVDVADQTGTEEDRPGNA